MNTRGIMFSNKTKAGKIKWSVAFYIVIVAVIISSCQPQPTAVPSIPTPTVQPKIESQPIADGPILLREGIELRHVAKMDGGSIKMALHPLTGDLYILNPGSGLFRIKISQSSDLEKLATPKGIVKGALLSGMVFGPDGTLYTVANRVVEKINNQAIILKGVEDAEGKFQWVTLAETEPYPLSNTYYDHLYNGIAVSPDGKWVYVSAGSRTEHGEVEDNDGAFPNTRDVALTARILRLPLLLLSKQPLAVVAVQALL